MIMHACLGAPVEALRADGFDHRAISDAVHVVRYFNYINRVADGLGVDLEEWMPPHLHGDRDARSDPSRNRPVPR
jgi:hypothetical protein